MILSYCLYAKNNAENITLRRANPEMGIVEAPLWSPRPLLFEPAAEPLELLDEPVEAAALTLIVAVGRPLYIAELV
jgi:hypothetical protein